MFSNPESCGQHIEPLLMKQYKECMKGKAYLDEIRRDNLSIVVFLQNFPNASCYVVRGLKPSSNKLLLFKLLLRGFSFMSYFG